MAMAGGTKRFKLDLSEAFITKVPYDVRTLVIDKYDGASETCFIQFGFDLEDTREEIEHHKAWGWDEDKEIWIVNLSAQSGKELKFTIGGPGTYVSAGTTYNGVPVANQSSLAHGQVTVGTSEVALVSSSISVPDGFAAVIKYPSITANTGIVYVGLSGVTTADGYILTPGDHVELYITDLSIVHLISDTAGQIVTYIVEQ